jgi:hypothetical protein
MRIAYVVLTCEKYSKTRVEWQKRHMFSHIDMNDVYYLGHIMDSKNHQYSWGAADDYEHLTDKFRDFFKNTDLDYDWYMLIDDDTYVYDDRLRAALAIYHPDYPTAIGQSMEHLNDNDINKDLKQYFSGGAGTALSRGTYRAICEWICVATPLAFEFHWCADISLGMWLTQVDGIHMVHQPRFHADFYNEEEHDFKKEITYHHLKEESEYELCARLHGL